MQPAAWRGGSAFRFLDTGAMYRAVTLAARERGLDLADGEQLAQLAGRFASSLPATACCSTAAT